ERVLADRLDDRLREVVVHVEAELLLRIGHLPILLHPIDDRSGLCAHTSRNNGLAGCTLPERRIRANYARPPPWPSCSTRRSPRSTGTSPTRTASSTGPSPMRRCTPSSTTWSARRARTSTAVGSTRCSWPGRRWTNA